MKLRFILPNAFTCGNLLSGVLGIIYVLDYEHTHVLYFLFVASVFDFFDGFVARALKVSGEFGKQLDSLADVVSFGVLPSVYFYKLMVEHGYSLEVSSLTLLIAAFSALRLAKFNIDTEQSDKFIGLPTPANALLVGSVSPLLLSFSSLVLPLSFIAFSCFMLVSPFPMTALKFKNFKWSGNQSRFFLLIGGLILFSMMGYNAMPYIIPYYIFVSLGEYFYDRLQSRRFNK